MTDPLSPPSVIPRELMAYVQHKMDCPALPANFGRFTRNSEPYVECDCGLLAALACLEAAPHGEEAARKRRELEEALSPVTGLNDDPPGFK